MEMEKNTGKFSGICQSENVGTMNTFTTKIEASQE